MVRVKTRGGGGGGGSDYYVREIISYDSQAVSAFAASVARVYYSPIQVPHDVTADGVIVVHGNAPGGNFYVALYDHVNYAPVNRLAVSANTLGAGANCRQFIPFSTPVSLDAELYFATVECSATDQLVGVHDITSAVFNPAGIDNGLNHYYEDLGGGYAVPPLVANPTQVTSYLQARTLFLRISSIP